MAIVARGHTPCALCREVVGEHDDLVTTSHFTEHPNEVLAGFSDVPFHRGCFLRWPLRPAFVARYNTLVRRRARDGWASWMQDDGEIILQPSTPNTVAGGIEPLVVGIPSSERRPGLHGVINTFGQPLGQVRLVLSLRVLILSSRLRDALSEQVRVDPIGHAGMLVAAGGPGLPLRLLDAAPAKILSAIEVPNAGLHYIEVGGNDRNAALLRPGAAYAIRVTGDCQAAAIRCWAVQNMG